ncbi:MAG: hypothetical protein ABGW82_10510, partial [Paracoccus sp. (in: a-proteobacteria)]
MKTLDVITIGRSSVDLYGREDIVLLAGRRIQVEGSRTGHYLGDRPVPAYGADQLVYLRFVVAS